MKKTTKGKPQRMFAMAMAAAMVTSMVPVTAVAEGEVEKDAVATESPAEKPTVVSSESKTTEETDGSTTISTTAQLSNGASLSVDVNIKEQQTTDTTENGNTVTTDKKTTTWNGTITNGDQSLIDGSNNENKPEELNSSEDPTGKGGNVDVDGNGVLDDVDDLVNNFVEGSKAEGEKTTFNGSETQSDSVEKDGEELERTYGSVSGSNTTETVQVKKEQHSEVVSNNSEKTKPELVKEETKDSGIVEGKFAQNGETQEGTLTEEDLPDFTAPSVSGADYDADGDGVDDRDIQATVTPDDPTTKDVNEAIATETEYLTDWDSIFAAKVKEVQDQVTGRAAATAAAVTGVTNAAADEAAAQAAKTAAEDALAAERAAQLKDNADAKVDTKTVVSSYAYSGTDANGAAVVKTVVVVKVVDAETGDVSFETNIEEIVTPKMAVDNEESDLFDPENPGTPDATNTTFTFKADNTVTKTELVLPEEPKVGETITVPETGNVATTTKVEPIVEKDADGNDVVVGYKKYFVVTDKDGKELKNGSEEIRATQKTTTEKVNKTETIDKTYYETIVEERTVTKSTSVETVTMDVDSVYRKLVLEWLGASAGGTGTNIDGATLEWNALQPDLDIYEEVGHEDLQYTQDKDPTAAQFEYLKHVLRGMQVWQDSFDEKGNREFTRAFMYELVDKLESTPNAYGYCVDFSVDALKGYYYEVQNLDDHDESYYKGEKSEALKKIAVIAQNGFWGTKDGMGSLGNVQSVLKDYLMKEKKMTEEEAKGYSDYLTGAEALTATQVAIWKYGNSGDHGVYWEDIVKGTNGADQERVEYLIAALTSNNLTTANNATNILDEKDIESVSINVGEKVQESADGKTDKYETDVSFTLAVVPTENDDLIVQVYNGTTLVETRRISGTAAEDETFGSATKSADGKTYTIDNIQLQEGVNIKLNITGAQVLKQGVYIYSSEYNFSDEQGKDIPSQSFVTVAQGKRKVNLDVNMTFQVNDPANGSVSGSTESSNYSRNDKRTVNNTWAEQDQIVTALVEVTTETITTASSTWGSSYDNYYSGSSNQTVIKDEKTPQSGAPVLEEILEEEVPLAEGEVILSDVPQTNDASGLWLALSGISGMLFAGLKRRKKA